jgi:nicotinamidase-related amidase
MDRNDSIDGGRSPRPGVLAALVLAAALAVGTVPASAATIIDDWQSIRPPPPPALHPVQLDPQTSALLVLDLVKQTCNETRRPRCPPSLPKVAELLKTARAHHMLVVYTVVMANKATEDVLPEVAPLGGEPMVKSGPDKFINTELDQILKSHGITTVVAVGTAAEGAVLYTASHAALLGYSVVLPVDGMSSASAYPEQYVTWNMANAPSVSTKVTLTAIDQIGF